MYLMIFNNHNFTNEYSFSNVVFVSNILQMEETNGLSCSKETHCTMKPRPDHASLMVECLSFVAYPISEIFN